MVLHRRQKTYHQAPGAQAAGNGRRKMRLIDEAGRDRVRAQSRLV